MILAAVLWNIMKQISYWSADTAELNNCYLFLQIE